MRDNVRFRCPRDVVGADEDPTVFGVKGAAWFAAFLGKVPRLEVDPELLQEDWGTVIFVALDRCTFWVGLSPTWDAEHHWRAHVHHRGMFQRFTRGGRKAKSELLRGIDGVLRAEADVSDVEWIHERDA